LRHQTALSHTGFSLHSSSKGLFPLNPRISQSSALGEFRYTHHPCPHTSYEAFLWTEQNPQGYTHLGTDSRFSGQSRGPRSCLESPACPLFQASFSISRASFLFTAPEWTTGPSHFPQLRPCGVPWYAHYPVSFVPSRRSVTFLGPNSTPELCAPRCASRSRQEES